MPSSVPVLLLLALLLPSGSIPAGAAAPSGPPASPPQAAAGLDPVPTATAVRTTGPVTLDGRMDDPAWNDAPAIRGFVQRDPEEGAPASQPIDVRILFDDEALYVGARLSDTDPVSTRLGRRDMPLLDSDWFGVTLDSYHDLRTGFRFQVNPAGVQRDAAVTMGSGGAEVEDLSWDPIWQVETHVDGEGWTVEMRIPFSQLRFRRLEDPVWGLQIERIIGRRGEVAHFAFVPRSEPGGIPSYGHLVGLRGIEPGNRLEVVPYVVARGEFVDPGANPFRSDREFGADAGADLAYRITSDLTLNATLNPDFGQVEVDPAVVELGVYETFFPERRPFFVEGGEIFRFTGNTSGGQLFYSRRIGRRPQVHTPSAASDVADATRILGAAKVSGRVGGWSVGVMDAVTGTAEGRFMADGEAGTWVAEPLANYFVARVRRDLSGGRSAFGGALTSMLRRTDAPEARATLHAGAWGGGADFRHEWSDRRWQLTGSLAGSHVHGSTTAITSTQRQPHHYFQRPDADHLTVDTLATSLSGYSVGMNLTRQAGDRWLGSVAAAATSPGYEVNDLGFGMRTDRQDLQVGLTHRQTRPGDFMREWALNAQLRAERNFDGDLVQRTTSAEAWFRHLDFWTMTAVAWHSAEAYDDRSTRGGPLMIRPSRRGMALRATSDPRRSITVSSSVEHIRGDHGASEWNAGGSLQLRTSPWWNLSVGPSLGTGRIAAQYIATVPDAEADATFGSRYLFAPLELTELRADLRLNVTLTPRLSLETYAQPLLFAFDYGDVVSLAAPRTFDFEPWEGELPPLDRTLRSLRGNAVLRWEWRPGSTLYLAWQQRRQGFGEGGELAFREDARALFSTPADDILVLKASYWFNP